MRAPSHAPAVRYPFGRSRGLGGCLAVVAVCGLASVGAWLLLGTADAHAPIKAVVGLGTWVLSAAAAWHGWRAMPAGNLSWDGAQWLLDGETPARQQLVQGWPQVHLDLQSIMLLSLQPAQGRAVWLWLERGRDPTQWPALRRAIYSPARAKAPGAAETMNATSSRPDDGSHPRT